jgi:hypothetical protein
LPRCSSTSAMIRAAIARCPINIIRSIIMTGLPAAQAAAAP